MAKAKAKKITIKKGYTPKKTKVMTKSQAAKKARAGKDMGKPGKGFKKGVSNLMSKGMPMKRAKKIMGAQFQKMRKKGML